MKAAVIGCGRIGTEHSDRLAGEVPAGWLPVSHVETLTQVPAISDIALCDLNQNKLSQSCKNHKITNGFLNYRELIESFEPELVTIATRTPDKIPIIKYLCEMRVGGIYIEKPIANSIGECRQVMQWITNSQAKIGYGVTRRHHMLYQRAKQLVTTGVIGKVIGIDVEHGPAQLLWTHPHSTDILLYFADSTCFEVRADLVRESVKVVSDCCVDSDPIIESAEFKFENGVVGRITNIGGWNVRIYGSVGYLVIHGNGSCLQLNTRERENSLYFLKQEMVPCVVNRSSTVNAIKELSECIGTKTETSIKPQDICMGLEMLMGAVWSHLQGGVWIQTKDIPLNLVVTGRYGDLYA